MKLDSRDSIVQEFDSALTVELGVVNRVIASSKLLALEIYDSLPDTPIRTQLIKAVNSVRQDYIAALQLATLMSKMEP